MIQKAQILLRDQKGLRWLMLLLVALTMFAVYVVSDVFSPLKSMLEAQNEWNSMEYGLFSSAYSFLNVFLGMLILGGILLDKKGIRFTGLLSCILMVAGIAFKYWAVSNPELIKSTIHLFGAEYKKQVVFAVLGYAVFGVGAEVAGISVSKAIVKWFKGKELALAMGLQLSLARLGSAGALAVAPMIAGATGRVSTPVLVGLFLLVLGGLCFAVYALYDKKLDKQIAAEPKEEESSFSLKDVGAILKNPGFWHIALLCVLFYSAVFPFMKYATDLMVNKFSVDPKLAGLIPSMLPFGAIILTPLFGSIYDKVGKGANLMLLGATLITTVHVLFAAPFVHEWWMAVILMIVLGIGFSLVPSAMWPSLAKIMPEKQYGTAIALTFFVQNIGLWGVPLLIGWVLDKYCITGTRVIDSLTINSYDYTLPMTLFAIVCGSSILVALSLKRLNKKKNYGLQEANIKKN